MKGTGKQDAVLCVMAPLTGQTVALDQVPDPVFAEKVLGDGVAIIPEDGKILSPVTGEVTSVAATQHAYGFQSEDGLEVLVHVGLETVGLQGEGFTVHVKEGDKVKAGDLIAEVDLELLKSKNIKSITPVLICDGIDDKNMEPAAAGMAVKAGESAVLFVKEAVTEAAPAKADTAVASEAGEAKEEKKKFAINFDFLQKLGKVLMTVIAVMPAAGLMLSIGKLVQMAGADVSILMTLSYFKLFE